MHTLTDIYLSAYVLAMQTATFRALGEPNRLQIVELLRSGPRPVGEIVEHLDSHQPQVSKHLRVLADSGVVTAERHGRQRVYRIEAAPFAELQEWIDTFEHTWSDRLDRLGTFLDAASASGEDERGR